MKILSQTDQGNNKIVNVADPTSAQDAATKNYVDSATTAAMPANTLRGNNTGSSASPANLTASQVKSMLAIGEGDVTNLTTDLNAKASTSYAIAMAIALG